MRTLRQHTSGTPAMLALVVVLLAMFALGTGCSDEPAEESAAQDTGVTYEVMEMDANAKAALSAMPKYVEDYVGYAEEDAETEGVDYLDVRGIEPSFIGYEVVAWEEIEGSEDVEYVEVEYINGHIAQGYATPEDELSSEPDLYTYDAMNTRGVPENASEGELAAIEAAKAKLAEFFDDLTTTQYGIKRYLFLYEKDGQGLVMGMTADGELGSNSEPVDLAE